MLTTSNVVLVILKNDLFLFLVNNTQHRNLINYKNRTLNRNHNIGQNNGNSIISPNSSALAVGTVWMFEQQPKQTKSKDSNFKSGK